MKKNIEFLGFIPARGGSKRLIRKNLRKIIDKELIYYTIREAQKSLNIDQIIFSTEDSEIASVAKFYGSELIDIRPDYLADDKTTNIEVMQYYIKKLSKMGTVVQNIVLLQPTSPLRTFQDIDNAIEIFKASDLPTLASVVGPYKKRHPIFMRKTLKSSKEVLTPLKINHEDNVFKYNASIYIAKVEYLMTKNSIFSDPQAFYLMKESQIDIDTEEDLEVAEAIMRLKNRI